MKRVCVFCGSSPGARQEYVDAAIMLGRTLAQRKIGLVYGGGKVGLMGYTANAAAQAGGEVIGVIPKGLVRKEVAFTALGDLRVVDTMHERKALMAELSDGFIAMPGGLGTLEEFFEALTWAQLGMHEKPCGFLNVCHYYDSILGFLDSAEKEQFIDHGHREMILVDESPGALLDQFAIYKPPTADKAAWALQLTGVYTTAASHVKNK
ncbi:MAG TPA: TIGR00730 family Rossman fold protein [Methanocellaceae archaeon]